MAYTRLYRDGKLEAKDFPVEQISDHLADPGSIVWFDLCAPTREDLDLISEELGLHALSVENALNQNQRPKLDVFDSHVYLKVYAATFDAATAELGLHEASAFATDRALVTVRNSSAFDIDAVVRRWDASGQAGQGVAHLLHGLLDYVVDSHFDAVQAMDDKVEDLEERLFDETPPNRDEQRRTFQLRKSLVNLRRVVLPMREVVTDLLRRDTPIGEAAVTPYFQDLYDHVLRVTEWTESLRELVGNIRETHLNLQNARMNMIMKRVTSWAAIIAVPTLITGFYGMNVPYPGNQTSAGVWWAISIIAITSSVLWWQFKKRDWL